jgi:Zn-dependent protease with chaperone function
MREYIGVTGGELTPSWVKVSSKGKEGWVPARALVLPVEFATASDAMAASRASGANKGFSEKVKKDARAMKGAAGTPALKGANYATADAIIESAQKPLDFSKKSSPWAPATRITAAPALGEDLKELDPAAAAAAAAALAKVNEPGDMSKSMDAAEGASGLLGSFGISQAEDPSVKTAMQVAKAVAQILDILGKTTPVTPVEERALGRECLALLVGDSEVLPPSHPVACYVRWLGTRIAANSTCPYPSLGLDFIVLNAGDEVNAVAVPGGPIVITTGMLSFLESEDELAAILGHELGHVEERHGLKIALAKGMDKWASILSVLSMQADGQLDPFIDDLIQQMKLSDEVGKLVKSQVKEEVIVMAKGVFEDAIRATVDSMATGADQGAETGADLRGMSLASASGYDPYALDIVLERLKSKTGEYGGANYDANRAGLARSVVVLLPPTGEQPADSASPHVVTPSAESAQRWSKVDDELGKL